MRHGGVGGNAAADSSWRRPYIQKIKEQQTTTEVGLSHAGDYGYLSLRQARMPASHGRCTAARPTSPPGTRRA
ncbi:unnamed protein product [Urochloa humidicola]